MIDHEDLLREFKALNAKKRRDPMSLTKEERAHWKEMRRMIEMTLFRTAADPGADTREYLRVPASLSVRYWTRNELKDRYISVLGEGGLFVSAVDPLPVGSMLDLEVTLQAKNLTAKVQGEVVWVNDKGDPAKQGMGIRFVDMSYDQKRCIYDLVDDTLRQSLLERRKFARLNTKLQVKFVFAEGFFELETSDLSMGGVFIATDHLVPVGEEVRLVLHIPGDKPVIKALGKVVRVVEEDAPGQPAGLGVRFLELGPDGEKCIRKYLGEQVTTQLKTNGKQRRRFPRLETLVKLRFQAAGSFEPAISKDISSGGIFVQTLEPPAKGEEIWVNLVHPTTSQKLDLVGKVVRVVKRDPKNPEIVPGVGVSFENLSVEKKAVLDMFLKDFALLEKVETDEDNPDISDVELEGE